MSTPFFKIEYQDLQDRAVETLGRNLTSVEIERSKWILFDLSSDLLDNVLTRLQTLENKDERE